MNITQAKAETKLLIDSGQAIMWSGPSGIGKSQSAFALAEDIKADGAKRGETWGIGIMFGATHTPPDILGYMYKGERDIPVGFDEAGKMVTKKITVTDPSVPLWMLSTEGKPAFCYDRFFLIIDEYGQTDPDTKKPMAEVFLNGGSPPWHLPAGSVRLGLTNEGARYGVTKDFLFCIARRTMLNITGDIEPFLNHIERPYMHQGRVWETMGVTKAWAAANPQIVFEKEPEKDGAWCSPRQLLAYDRYLQLKFAATGKQEIDPAAMDVGAGTIGMAATTSFVAHTQYRLQLPSYADVVANPDTVEVPSKGDLQMLMAYELASYAKTPDLPAVFRYMARIEAKAKDMGITFVTSLLRRDYRNVINTPAMQAWINKNAAAVTILNSLSQA